PRAFAGDQSTLLAALRAAGKTGARGRWQMKLRSVIVGLAVLALAFLGSSHAALAHPLGNFSINHLTQVSVSSDRVDARYILDQAEIPTFQERGLSDAEITRRKEEELRRGLRVEVDGRPVP